MITQVKTQVQADTSGKVSYVAKLLGITMFEVYGLALDRYFGALEIKEAADDLSRYATSVSHPHVRYWGNIVKEGK